MAQLPWLMLQSWQELHKIPVLNPYLSLLFIFSILYVSKLILKSGKSNLPPSPTKLPIIGNLHQLGTLPHRSFRSLSKKYGPVMLLHLGHAPSLVVSSANMAREVMKTHDITFSNRPRATAADIILYGCTDIGFASYGEYWRQARKSCVLELLSLRAQSFQYVREEEVLLLTNRIRESCLKQTSVNLSEMFFVTSNNIVSTCTLGQKYEGGDARSRFQQLPRRIMVLLTAFCIRDFFPSLGWIDVLTGLIPSLKTISREIDPFLDQVIEEHKRMRSENEKTDMFVGGSETSSTTLEWLMAELIKNPNIMKREQEEVRRVMGNKLKIDENDINQMGYLKSWVKFGGYEIPPETIVYVNVWAIQRDPKIWERSEEFLPERFIDNPIDFRGQDFEFLPFGGGRRGCPRLPFGLASVEHVIANMLCWFDWRLPIASAKGQDLDMGEVYGLTVGKKIPLHLVPTLHSP
ncbi:hypothetical protein I3843_11G017200 [Carya illinoinensis]|nr:hypothetical protein I3843_11G017200 [Carya illinoinensis]